MLMTDFHWDVKCTVNSFDCKSLLKASKLRYTWLESFRILKQGKLKLKANSIVGDRRLLTSNL